MGYPKITHTKPIKKFNLHFFSKFIAMAGWGKKAVFFFKVAYSPWVGCVANGAYCYDTLLNIGYVAARLS